ncbi:MAG: putative bifunctional diguanylate cyclase/phosphodiesterase, partial [Hyphomicrobiales bacterium]
MAIPAILISADMLIISINRPALSALGVENAGCVLECNLSSLMCPRHSRAFGASLGETGGGSFPLGLGVVRLQNHTKTQAFSVHPLFDSEGAISGYLCQSDGNWSGPITAPKWHGSLKDMPQRSWELNLKSGQVTPIHPKTKSILSMTAQHLSEYFLTIHPDDLFRLQYGLASLASVAHADFAESYRVKLVGGEYTEVYGVANVIQWTTSKLPQTLLVNEINVGDAERSPRQNEPDPNNEDRWKTAVLSANQAVWDHDFERDSHYLSDTWRDLRGLGNEESTPHSTDEWLETIHPQDVDQIREELRRIDTGQTDIINYKFRQRHKNGHWVWFLSRGRIVRRDADGLPVRMIGTDTDITDIKTVELESQRMAQRLDVAMEAAGMARWEFNINKGEAYWDDRLLKMFGVKDGKNIRPGSDWESYIHPEDQAYAAEYTQLCLDRKEDVAHDYRLVTVDGQIKHIRARGKYVEHSGGDARYYGVNFDITQDKLRTQELENARALLEHESRHDALTGLSNRRKLDEVFSEYAQKRSDRIAVLHFDIDHFKQINDTLGHDAGDATLKHAADVLMRNTPEAAMVSRVGGDEFVVMLIDAPDDTVLGALAEKIIQEMSQPFYYEAQECNIGTSIGISTTSNMRDHGSALFIDADLALYEAKKAGRGRYRFFTASMKDEARKRKNSFDALSAGFDNGEITCHYQPQFDALSLEVTGLEALVRWESPQFGLMMPQEFLQTAEDMGLLPQFDELVLRRALYDMNQWEKTGLSVPPISVNVSAHRLNDPSLGEQLRVLDLPRDMLSFELLESAFLDDRNDVIDRNLRLISSMGIDIEIDDFGSGHASIASLLEIKPTRLKIDRFLIQPIVESEQQRELVKTIIGIGRMLGIKVV